MGLTIRRTVTVKAIVTDRLKQEVAAEMQEALRKIDNELAQIDFHGKRALMDIEKNSPDKIQAVKRQVEDEKQKRLEAKARITDRLKDVAQLEDGHEVVHSTVESQITVDVGDRWSKIAETEIILRDGIIVAIRNL